MTTFISFCLVISLNLLSHALERFVFIIQMKSAIFPPSPKWNELLDIPDDNEIGKFSANNNHSKIASDWHLILQMLGIKLGNSHRD